MKIKTYLHSFSIKQGFRCKEEDANPELLGKVFGDCLEYFVYTDSTEIPAALMGRVYPLINYEISKIEKEILEKEKFLSILKGYQKPVLNKYEELNYQKEQEDYIEDQEL